MTLYSTTLDLDRLSDDLAPLYSRYAGQSGPQPAHVELDERGSVTATVSSHIGNGGCSMLVWHGRTLQWSLPPDVRRSALVGFLARDDVRSLLDRVHAGHSVQWDGSNHRGTLTDDARRASDEFETLLLELNDERSRVTVWQAGDFVFAGGNNHVGDVWPSGTELSDAVEGLKADASREGCYLDGDVHEEIMSQALAMIRDETPGLTAWHVAQLVSAGAVRQEQGQAYLAATGN